MPHLQILYEDNHLLVINKPAGLPTMGAAEGDATLARLAKAHLKRKYQKPGNVYLGVVSRLDSPVTGVTLFARTSKAAGRLSAMFRERRVEKSYWALVSAARHLPIQGTLKDWLRKDEPARKMTVCGPHDPGAQAAQLTYRVRGQIPGQVWLEIDLQTGRKHQIRTQLEAAGCPVLGDRRYGSRVGFPRGIALHARRLVLTHPVGGQPLDLVAPVPAYWPSLPSDP